MSEAVRKLSPLDSDNSTPELPERIGPYRIDRLLARTELSEVYLAHTAAAELVCVKRPRPALVASNAMAVLHFRKEAALLADIRHPNVVRVLDRGTADGIPYICLEYIDGQTLREHLGKGPCPLLDSLEILRQTASALAEVHGQRILHGDLKPENILLRNVSEKIEVKLVDFGLAGHVDERAAGLAGTLHYIAPEQTELLDWPLAEYSDLYSLGAVAFELLTGRVPFDESDPAALLAAHVAQVPPKPSSLAPHIPPLLDRLILKLLAKNPTARYRSAASLAHDLGHIAQMLERALPSPILVLDTLPDATLSIGQAFVGRIDELSRLEELFDVARNGYPSFGFLGGDPGVGKSTLVRELRNRSLTRGARFASGKSYEFDRALPYFVLSEAIRDYLQRLAKLPQAERDTELERIRGAVGEQGGLVAQIIPELSVIFPDSTRKFDGTALSQSRIHWLLARLLEAMAPVGQPLVLVLEDLQWVDTATLRFIEFLFESLSNCSVLVVATYRSNEVADGSPLHALLRKSERQLHAVRLALAPFDEAETARMVADSLRLPSASLLKDVAALVHERTGGNPLFIIEILKALIDSGALTLQDGIPSISLERVETSSLPSSTVAAILRRVRELEPWVCRVLGAAARVGNVITIRIVAEVIGLSEEQVFEAVHIGIDERILVATTHSRFRFYHDQVQEACGALIPEDERAALHQRILQVREELEPEIAEQAFELARHAVLAHDSARIWRYSLAAAQLASKRYANEQAISCFRQALEHADAAQIAQPEQLQIRFEKALCLQRIGSYDEATAIYEQILKQPLDAEQKARCWNGLSLIAQKTGDYERSEELSLRAAAELGLSTSFGKLVWAQRLRYAWKRLWRGLVGPRDATPSALLRIEILTRLCYLAVNGKQTQMLAVNSYRLLSESLTYGDSIQLVHAYHIYATGLWEQARPRVAAAEKVAKSSVAMAKRLGAHAETGISMVYAGAMFLWSGRVREALPWFENARDVLSSAGERWQLANVYIFLYRCYKELGRLDDCITAAQTLCELGERIQAVGTLANGFQKLADILLLRGDEHAGEVHLERSLGLAQKHQLNFELFQIYKTRAAEYLRRGKYADARKHFRAAIELNESPGISFYRAYINDTYFGYAEAVLKDEVYLATTGGIDGEEGVRVSAYIDRGLAEETAMGGHLGHGYRARAWLQLRRRHLARSRRDFVRAMQVLEEQHRAIELALTQLDAASAVGGPYATDAVRWLIQARNVFRQQQLERLERACIGELERLGHAVELPSAPGAAAGEAAEELLEISRLLMEPSSMDVLFERIVDSSIRLLKAERAFLFTRPAEGAKLELHIGKTAEGKRLGAGEAYLSQSVIERVEASGQGVAVSDTTESEELRIQHSIVALGVRSVLCTSLTHAGQRFGVLYLDNQLTRAMYGENELEILNSLAAVAAIALSNAHRFRAIEDINRNLDRKVLERTHELEAANAQLAQTLSELENTTLRLAEAQRAALEQEIALARRVQTAMSPPEHVLDQPVARVLGRLESASSCGGDVWTYFSTGDRTVLFIGDVIGHGLGPAMVTAMVKSCFETIYSKQGASAPSLEEFIHSLDEVLVRATQGEYSMTGCAIDIDKSQQRLSYCLAGHCAPILLTVRDGRVHALQESPSSPLGTGRIGTRFESRQLPYQPGDRLVLYTDGLVECTNVDMKPFGVGKLSRLLKRSANQDLPDVLATVFEAVREYTDGDERHDDITLVIAELR